MKVGRRLATKLLNVTKFVLGSLGDVARRRRRRRHRPGRPGDARPPRRVIAEATTAFDGFDYARALERTEEFFWWFCDDYVELVKGRGVRRRGDDAGGVGAAALRIALDALQRLFAPALPFATEEAWSWWHDGSVHVAAWPAPSPASDRAASPRRGQRGARPVRRAKTEAKAASGRASPGSSCRCPASTRRRSTRPTPTWWTR